MLSFRTRGNFVDFVHTDNTSLEVESVIMSLHNTSKAVDWSLPEDTTRINFTIDDISYDNILITDIDFDGVSMTAQTDFKTNIETIFPGLAGGGAGSGVVETIVAGSGIAVDATDPANPEVSATGAVLSATVELTDAQIKALPTTYIEVVPAQGANKLVSVVGASFRLNTSAGAYTNHSTGNNAFFLAYGDWDVECSGQIAVPTGASDYMGVFSDPSVRGQVADFTEYSGWLIGASADVLNAAVKIVGYNPLGDFTGGNAANTLKITVSYIVLTL